MLPMIFNPHGEGVGCGREGWSPTPFSSIVHCGFTPLILFLFENNIIIDLVKPKSEAPGLGCSKPD